MKRIAAFFLFSVLLSQSVVIAQQEPAWQPTVLLVDFDDVLSAKQRNSFGDYFSFMKIVFARPKVITALTPGNFKKIRQEGIDLKKTLNGTSNIVHAVLQKLTDEGYGDLVPYVDDIVQRAVKPKPIRVMINNLHMLKKQGYMLVGATNQDYLQTKEYRRKFKQQHGIDLDVLFDVIVTTRTRHITPTDPKNGYYHMDKNVLMLKDPKLYKPNPDYFHAVKSIAREFHPGAESFIMTDDKIENLAGAKKAGVQTVHFNLPKGAAIKSTKKEIKRAVEGWKTGLALKRIVV